jgi:2-(1,2-epoxy-1,2-dihydrophenyl)acetyl-CoA isomerase
MSEATVLSERRGAVAHLTLNRPRAFNAMSPALMVEFRAAAAEIAADASVRAVVVTGAGKAFSAGGDLRSFADSDDVSGLLRTMTRDLHAGLVSLASMNAPVIAAVNGVAAGAGMSLAAACDLVVAAESATFTMAYTAAGLTPDGSSTWFLPRLIGLRRTQELMLTNRRLSAAEALDWQLVNQVVPDDQLGAEVEKLATRLACGATGAFGVVKKLLSASSNRELEAQLAAEAEGIASQAATPDGQEGIAAFLEKRKPEFSGS